MIIEERTPMTEYALWLAIIFRIKKLDIDSVTNIRFINIYYVPEMKCYYSWTKGGRSRNSFPPRRPRVLTRQRLLFAELFTFTMCVFHVIVLCKVILCVGVYEGVCFFVIYL